MSWQVTFMLFAYKSSKIWKVTIINDTSIHETCILCTREKEKKYKYTYINFTFKLDN